MRKIRKWCILYSIIIFVFVLWSASGPEAANPPPQLAIIGASADIEGGTITIEGRNFGTNPKVSIGISGGQLQALNVLEAQYNRIIAALTDFTPGTYMLSVSSGPATEQNDVMDFTIGAVGETGPPGPTGPQGAKGDKGDAGAVGPAGPAGAAGPQGPQGPIGPTGAQGPAGSQGAQGLTGPQGPQGIPGQDGQDGSPGLSKIYNIFDKGSGELPVWSGAAPPVFKKLDLPAGKYLVTAKVGVRQWSQSASPFGTAYCTIGTGPNVYYGGPDVLDLGYFVAYAPSQWPPVGFGPRGSIPLTAVLQLANQPGTVELRCSRNLDPVMYWEYVQLTAILVDEVVTQ